MSYNTNDLVRLRGHHLVCILTYAGYGYSPDFTHNMDKVVKRIKGGAMIKIVRGPDDICAGWSTDDQRHCDKKAEFFYRDVAGLLLASLSLRRLVYPGKAFRLDDKTSALQAFFRHRWRRISCWGCSWKSACEGISAAGYKKVLISHME